MLGRRLFPSSPLIWKVSEGGLRVPFGFGAEWGWIFILVLESFGGSLRGGDYMLLE